ncbi:glycosyl hydrolase family 18 protein [Paenibacillus sp. y28]|uniref:glycosyl hydrolase family 18 protein n=1 Tax=Paenibacillus sp. y28 TaxID=3129110 RepID=UPI0030159980
MSKKRWISAALSFALMMQGTVLTAAAADKTTKYRVYQNDQLLQEFNSTASAIQYARRWSSSHVEEIGTRTWIWDNLPRYKVYQYDAGIGEFQTLAEAIQEAKKWGHASIRDLQSSGWEWNNYPRYRLYQGDMTLDGWEFQTLKEAQAEAAKWSGAHIIDLANNTWIWDNITATQKAALRAGDKTYRVMQGSYTQDSWTFAYLEDAVQEALSWAGSSVVREDTKQTVYRNDAPYIVLQNSQTLDAFISLDAAIAYAKQWGHARVITDGRTIWTNSPYYQVYQNDTLIGEYSTVAAALGYAAGYANASIATLDGKQLWNNFRKLQLWGWNGVSSADTIKTQLSAVQGLDVNSPTWFQLADASGKLTDNSSKDMVAYLKQRGHQVHALVHNQFDASLTSAFLANDAAVQSFVTNLVERAAALGIDGLNIDFENLAGKDRAAFTAFMKKLTDSAHAKGLVVSVDLPRGSIKWNHLTAFDHEKLGAMVDYIVTMTYDQNWSSGPTAGSVAGLDWVEQGVQEFLSYGIPRDKLIMGIPFYVREWKIDSSGGLVSSRAVLMKQLSDLIKSKNAKLTWDSTYGQYKAEYTEDGYTFVLWMETEETVKARLAIAKKYELAGVAAWRLGYEQSDLWTMLLQEK